MFLFIRIVFSNTPYLITIAALCGGWYSYIRIELSDQIFHYNLLLAICILSIPFAKSIVLFTIRSYSMARNGVKVAATVTNIGTVFSNRATGLAEVEFEYEFRGKKYTKTDKIPLCPVGSKIDIIINPKHPNLYLHI